MAAGVESRQSSPVSESESQICGRCSRPVASSPGDYATFERMHYACFHYEFEHDPVDVDIECEAGGCPSRHALLTDSLSDWTDGDVAAFRMGRAVGLYERPGDWWRVKGTFWTNSAIGKGLREALMALVVAGLIEHRSEPDDQFRWRRT